MKLNLNIFNPILFISVFGFSFLFHIIFLNKNYFNSSGEIIVSIKRGDNLKTAARKLEDNQVIYNKFVLILLGRITGKQENIIPGEYAFSNGQTYMNVLNTITNPEIIRSIIITIPEGLNIKQIARLLQKQIGIDSVKFVNEAYNDSLIKILNIKASNLEGYLFPDTYKIQINTKNKEKEIIALLVNTFMKKINPALKEEINKRNLKLHDVITIASIIEGETKYEAEKKTIAGVYYNRLKKGMKLQADPTVQYAIPDGPKNRLMHSDLKFDSPYNTYIYKGLPPGPINNPGLSSIIAAIYPESHNFLYFVAKGDGSHRFAENYDEHRKNVLLYQQYLKDLEIKKNEKEGNR